MQVMGKEPEDERDYIVHDGLGTSHVMRSPKGELPQVRCVGCDD